MTWQYFLVPTEGTEFRPELVAAMNEYWATGMTYQRSDGVYVLAQSWDECHPAVRTEPVRHGFHGQLVEIEPARVTFCVWGDEAQSRLICDFVRWVLEQSDCVLLDESLSVVDLEYWLAQQTGLIKSGMRSREDFRRASFETVVVPRPGDSEFSRELVSVVEAYWAEKPTYRRADGCYVLADSFKVRDAIVARKLEESQRYWDPVVEVEARRITLGIMRADPKGRELDDFIRWVLERADCELRDERGAPLSVERWLVLQSSA